MAQACLQQAGLRFVPQRLSPDYAVSIRQSLTTLNPRQLIINNLWPGEGYFLTCGRIYINHECNKIRSVQKVHNMAAMSILSVILLHI